MKNTLLFLFSTLFILGLSTPAKAEPAETSQTYAVKGIVEGIDSDQHQISVHSENIPGYMPSMTMDYSVKDPSELKGITVGDKITFTLVVGKDQYIQKIHRVGHADSAKPTPKPAMTMPMSMPASLN